MSCKLVIPGRLPGLNDYTRENRAHRQKGAKQKRETEDILCLLIRQQLKGIKFARPVVIRYLWVEPNRLRDKDNIAFAKKYIQDALVTMQVLNNDGWEEIAGFSDEFAVDKKNPRIEITIEEL